MTKYHHLLVGWKTSSNCFEHYYNQFVSTQLWRLTVFIRQYLTQLYYWKVYTLTLILVHQNKLSSPQLQPFTWITLIGEDRGPFCYSLPFLPGSQTSRYLFVTLHVRDDYYVFLIVSHVCNCQDVTQWDLNVWTD